MGSLIKTVQLTEGVWRPSPFLEVSNLSMEEVPKANFCLDLILINDTQELQIHPFIYKNFRSVEMIHVSHSLNECVKQHFYVIRSLKHRSYCCIYVLSPQKFKVSHGWPVTGHGVRKCVRECVYPLPCF